MTDRFSNEKRSAIMRSVRSKNTRPEILVRRMLHASGFRYRLHQKELPGKPDIVMPKHRTVIFVNGCFWHGHTCKKGTTMPKTHAAFWQEKISANKQRDKKNRSELRKRDWRVIIVWECETKQQESLSKILSERLRSPLATRQ